MRRAGWISLAAALVLALGACGKQGPLRAPDDAEAAYTYPKIYPNPATVLPDPAQEPEARLRARDSLEGAGDIFVAPNQRRTTRTYGTPAPQ